MAGIEVSIGSVQCSLYRLIRIKDRLDGPNMQPLDKTLRNQLERAVKAARDAAENGAHAALEQLGVADPAPAAHLAESDREFRRRLRAHGRQLGTHSTEVKFRAWTA